jgi:O-antigen/teichoic acid export membrane protein
MANRAVGRPLRAISQSVSDAILRHSIGERHEGNPIGPSIWKAAIVLAAIGIPGFALVYSFGGDLLTWMLGDRWADAGRMLEILAIYILSFWMASPFTTVFETLRKNQLQLYLHIGNLSVGTVTFTACHMWQLDIFATLWTFSVVQCAYQGLAIVVSVSVIRRHDVGVKQVSVQDLE